MQIIKDLTGMKFGRLFVSNVNLERRSNGHILWNCLCDCGNQAIVTGSNLRNNHTTSCGCYQKEIRITHGMSHYPEYSVWEGMIQRCNNKNFKQYSDYGGRGITVCEEWRNSFENFYSDMGPRPSPDHSIDRRENDGNYEKDNCYWATRTEQMMNRRNNVFYEYNGTKLSLINIANTPEAKRNNINFHTLAFRIRIMGMSVEDALSTPVKEKTVPTYTHNGITKTIKEWSIEHNVDYRTLYNRLKFSGWDFNRSVTEPVIIGSKPTITHTHNGITKTISEWSRQYGIKYDKLYDRLICSKWTLQKAIETP